jgi:hypothetical protein
MDHFDATMLLAKGTALGVDVKLPQAWQKSKLFP